MRKSLQIFKRDIQRLFHNKVAVIVMAGVCILPSLYAWFNIAANMDPYSNTQGIKVAVANSDSGSKSDVFSLNAGESIVDNLKENDQLGWNFVDEEAAVEGVRSGEYYAAIVIPEDFSSKLLSILSGTPETPKLSYYINEKKNAIAPKITDTAAGSVQQEINDTFSSVAAEAVSRLIQSAASEVSGDMEGMNFDVMAMLDDTSKNLQQYQDSLTQFQKTASGSSDLIGEAVQTLDQVKSAAESSSKVFSQASGLLDTSRDAASDFSTVFSKSLSEGENMLGSVYSTAVLKMGTVEAKAETVNGIIKDGINSVERVADKNETILEELEKLSGMLPENSMISDEIARLQQHNEQFQNLLSSLNAGNTSVGNILTTAKDTRGQLESLVAQNQQSLQGYRSSLNGNLLPKVNQSLDQFAVISGTFSGTLLEIPRSADQLQTILKNLDLGLSDGEKALESIGGALSSLEEQLSRISRDLQLLNNSQAYQELLSLEGIDADAISEFMESPVDIQTETLYEVENYGSAMTPFYTNLALWVGGIVLIAILKLEVDRDEKVKHFSASSAYFGRWFLYVVLGLIQGLIVCLGDLWLLKVQCLNPVAFVMAGMFCSFIYVNLIYALSITFKHIGKALCVILVILQIPGSAGTYPIEMTPAFFQKLHPFLPFTYGIDAMREAIAGMYQYDFLKNLLCLAFYLPAALLIGLGLRPLLLNLNRLFDQRLLETDLMICETESVAEEKPRLDLIVGALLGGEKTKEDVKVKAAAFEMKYPKRIKRGFILIILLPIIFLILMFSLESKIVFLVLWIASVIGIAIYLICLEYIRDRLKRQLAFRELSSEELLDSMKEDREA